LARFLIQNFSPRRHKEHEEKSTKIDPLLYIYEPYIRLIAL